MTASLFPREHAIEPLDGDKGRDLFRKKQLRAREALNEWILARKAEGYWVTLCAGNCGMWFAQLHTNIQQHCSMRTSGRRASLCGRAVCWRWLLFRKQYGRAAPPEMVLRWLEKYGNRMANGGHTFNPEKRAAQPRRRAV